MCKARPTRYRSYVERLTTPGACFFICLIGLTAAGGAFAQNTRTPVPHSGATSPYVVDGLALGARVDSESPAYRGYQCSPSELFPDFTRCQRTQRQQEGGTRRSFEATSSTLHGRDGKAVYINRHIAPWSFDRNLIQDEIKQLSSKFSERAREMRLPPREGVQTAIIAVWGKIQLTELDADAISILASGESPRKGLLIDYLGNLRQSAQQGLPIYSLTGGAGYIWSASVDRNNRGHIRVLTVDPSALSPVAPSAATAAEPTAAEPPSGEVAKIETAAAEKPNAHVEPPSVEPEATSVDAGIAKTEVKEAAAPEGDQNVPSLARLAAALATAEAKSRVMEKLAYWAVGGLIILLMIVVSLLLVQRKRANATEARVKSETQAAGLPVRAQASQTQAAGLPVRAQASQTQSSAPLEERSAPDRAAVSRGAAVADAIRFQNGSEQKQNIVNKDREQQLVGVNQKDNETAEPPSVNTTSCVHCHREISVDDKFCLHCGAAVAPKDAAAMTRLCSSCRQEIGASDRFCRHCGASSMAVVAPSMTANADSA